MLRFLLLVLFGVMLPAADIPRPVPQIDRIGWWDAPPVLHVCPSYEAPPQTIRKAVRKIRRHGGKFARVEWGLCEGYPDDGYIWLMGEMYGMPPGVVGITMVAGEPPTIASAAVIIRTEWAAGPALSHELLHALGLQHCMEPGHILYPQYHFGGPSWAGVREALAIRRPAP